MYTSPVCPGLNTEANRDCNILISTSGRTAINRYFTHIHMQLLCQPEVQPVNVKLLWRSSVVHCGHIGSNCIMLLTLVTPGGLMVEKTICQKIYGYTPDLLGKAGICLRSLLSLICLNYLKPQGPLSSDCGFNTIVSRSFLAPL